MRKINKLKSWERDKIAICLASGTSRRSIAKQLGRSMSSVVTEIKRNSTAGVYQAIKAQELSEARNNKSRKLNPLKSKEVYSYVLDKLRSGWTPEQIAGRSKRDNAGITVICHETIYNYIYTQDGIARKLSQYLVRKHRKRRPWYGRCLYRRGIQNRTSIKDRAQNINTRLEFGHWEGDVVEGRGHLSGIQSVLERKTRYYDSILIPAIDSEYGYRAQASLLTKYPPWARQTLTLDNGKENYNHLKLKRDHNISTYFCDPHAAWQKGSIENHNGVLRRYIPKKTDLTTIDQAELNAIICEINNRPRKCLNYQTPYEAFQRELQCYQFNK